MRRSLNEGTEEGELISEEGKKDEKVQDEEMTQEQYLMYQPLIEQLYPLCWKLLTAAPNSSLRISVIQVQVLKYLRIANFTSNYVKYRL